MFYHHRNQRRYNDTPMMLRIVRHTVKQNLRAKRGISYTIKEDGRESPQDVRYCIKSKNVCWEIDLQYAYALDYTTIATTWYIWLRLFNILVPLLIYWSSDHKNGQDALSVSHVWDLVATKAVRVGHVGSTTKDLWYPSPFFVFILTYISFHTEW